MAVAAARVSVGNTATRLDVTTESDAVPGTNTYAQRFGQHLMVRNRDASLSVFIGGPGLTATSGSFEVLPGEAVPVDLTSGDVLYGITASGTAVCHVIQTGV